MSIASRVVPATLGDDHALLAEEAVDERGLADVRAADHGEADRVVVRLAPRPSGSSSTIRSSRSPEPRPCAAETASGSPRPRRWNSAASGRSRDAVALVGGDDRSAAASGAAGRPSPRRPGARRRGRRRRAPPPRVGQPGARLVADRAGQRVLVLEVDAAGVDQREAAPVPLAVELLAVARDPRALVHDRLAGAREAVDQRGLAHVRIADDGDLHQASMTGRRRLPAQRSRASRGDARRDALDDRADVEAGACRASTAPGAARRGLCARVAVALVAHRLLGQHGRRRRRRARAARRRARSPGSAVRKTFSSASGATTVPMSRPSATQSPRRISPRCLATSASRTPGSAATREAASETSGVRIAALTSRPSSSTRPAARPRRGQQLDVGAARQLARARRRGCASESSATQRYIAPLSR